MYMVLIEAFVCLLKINIVAFSMRKICIFDIDSIGILNNLILKIHGKQSL